MGVLDLIQYPNRINNGFLFVCFMAFFSPGILNFAVRFIITKMAYHMYTLQAYFFLLHANSTQVIIPLIPISVRKRNLHHAYYAAAILEVAKLHGRWHSDLLACSKKCDERRVVTRIFNEHSSSYYKISIKTVPRYFLIKKQRQ